MKQIDLISLVIPAKNEGENVRNTIQSAFQVKTDYSFEIIVVDDNSIDGCCDFLTAPGAPERTRLVRTPGMGAAMARNVGAEYANGDVLIFCDAHLFFEDYWIDKLMEPIRSEIADAINPGICDVKNPSVVGCGYHWNEFLEPKWNTGQTELFASPHLAGGCLAVTREAFTEIGGFERGFRVWGREDEEISLKLWLFGFKCYVLPDVKISHVFRPTQAPFFLSWNDLNYNLMRMAYSHFKEERIEKCKALIKYSDPDDIVRQVLENGVLEQRSRYFARRTYTDDWFMERFQIPF